METKMKHTPLPWVAEYPKNGPWTISNPNAPRPRHPLWGNGVEVAVFREAINGGGPSFGPRDLKTEAEAGADAAFVIQACNNFDRMAEVLKKVRPHIALEADLDPKMLELLNEIEAVLKEAGVE